MFRPEETPPFLRFRKKNLIMNFKNSVLLILLLLPGLGFTTVDVKKQPLFGQPVVELPENDNQHHPFLAWRFISPDPERQYHNSYSYADNNPVQLVDPNGESFVSFLVKAGAKKATKAQAKNYIKTQIQQKLKRRFLKNTTRYGSSAEKKFIQDPVKKLMNDADRVTQVLTDSWWEIAIELTPGVGDVYVIYNAGKKGRMLFKQLDNIHDAVENPSIVKKNYKLIKNLNLDVDSEYTMKLLKNLNMRTGDFPSKYLVGKGGKLSSKLATEYLDMPLREALTSGSSTVRKLLTDKRFRK